MSIHALSDKAPLFLLEFISYVYSPTASFVSACGSKSTSRKLCLLCLFWHGHFIKVYELPAHKCLKPFWTVAWLFSQRDFVKLRPFAFPVLE